MSCSCQKHDEILVGSKPRIEGRLTTDDQPVNSATVTLTLQRPDETEFNVTPIEDGDGWYHADVTVDQAGQWRYQLYAPETGAKAEGSFIVKRSAFN